jgi:Fe-S cluster assembly protein SufB
MSEQDKILADVTQSDYKYGFYSDIEHDSIPKGLNEDVIRLISAKKNEPDWLLEYRLNAYRGWLRMKMPKWQNLKIPEINYQDIIYYSAPRQQNTIVWMRLTLIYLKLLINWEFL